MEEIADEIVNLCGYHAPYVIQYNTGIAKKLGISPLKFVKLLQAIQESTGYQMNNSITPYVVSDILGCIWEGKLAQEEALENDG